MDNDDDNDGIVLTDTSSSDSNKAHCALCCQYTGTALLTLSTNF
jgi:hypothetical protein